MSNEKVDRLIGRRLDQIFAPASQRETGTVAERLSKTRQERETKAAFAAKLTAAPKRRK